MARDVDPRRTRKAQRLVDRLQRAAATAPEPLSAWEDAFLDEVGQRLGKYGSSFRDLGKGRAEDAVSRLQAQKLKEIAAKASGKAKKQAEKRAEKRRKALAARAQGGGGRAPRGKTR